MLQKRLETGIIGSTMRNGDLERSIRPWCVNRALTSDSGQRAAVRNAAIDSREAAKKREETNESGDAAGEDVTIAYHRRGVIQIRKDNVARQVRTPYRRYSYVS